MGIGQGKVGAVDAIVMVKQWYLFIYNTMVTRVVWFCLVATGMDALETCDCGAWSSETRLTSGDIQTPRQTGCSARTLRCSALPRTLRCSALRILCKDAIYLPTTTPTFVS